MKSAKTGGDGGIWVGIESPKPPRVDDHYRYWGSPPPEPSERCRYWLRQIERGWRPNRRIATEGYDAAAHWYGVYLWEYLNVLCPALGASTLADTPSQPDLTA